MTPSTFSLDDAMAVLARTPGALTALLQGLPDTWIRATKGDKTWSPYEVIGHLIHGERTNWIPRAKHILAGEARPFDPFDRSPLATQHQDLNLTERLAMFESLRRENLALLAGMNLSDADFTRVGRHPELGTVTLGQLLATWVVHDLDHLGQVARTMAKAYTGAVGPWAQYLSILKDRQVR